MSVIAIAGNSPLTGSVITYFALDRGGEQKLQYKDQPFYFQVSPGEHEVFLTTVKPLQRRLNDGSALSGAVTGLTDDTWHGTVNLAEDEALFVFAESKFKNKYHMHVVKISELQSCMQYYLGGGAQRAQGKKKHYILPILALLLVLGLGTVLLIRLLDRTHRKTTSADDSSAVQGEILQGSDTQQGLQPAESGASSVSGFPSASEMQPDEPAGLTEGADTDAPAPVQTGDLPREGSMTALSTAFSSSGRILNYNDTVYYLNADGLYSCRDGKQVCVYNGSLDTRAGFCLDGRTAFVKTSDGWIVRVQIAEHSGEKLFRTGQDQIVGYDPGDGTGHTGATVPTLYLGEWFNYDSELSAFDLEGTELSEVGEYSDAGMTDGALLYLGARTDISPVYFHVLDDRCSVTPQIVSDAAFVNNTLYYAVEDRTFSFLELHCCQNGKDETLRTIRKSSTNSVELMGYFSDVGDALAVYDSGSYYLSLPGASEQYPAARGGRLLFDRCSGTAYCCMGGYGEAQTLYRLSGSGLGAAVLTASASTEVLLVNNGYVYLNEQGRIKLYGGQTDTVTAQPSDQQYMDVTFHYDYVDFRVPISGYIIEDSDRRLLTEADLYGLTEHQCCLARNEIYARHGRIFRMVEVADYFEQMPWYHGTVPGDVFDSNTGAYLNEIETQNISVITAYEKSKGW